jgi:hypothetical protein
LFVFQICLISKKLSWSNISFVSMGYHAIRIWNRMHRFILRQRTRLIFGSLVTFQTFIPLWIQKVRKWLSNLVEINSTRKVIWTINSKSICLLSCVSNIKPCVWFLLWRHNFDKNWLELMLYLMIFLILEVLKTVSFFEVCTICSRYGETAFFIA